MSTFRFRCPNGHEVTVERHGLRPPAPPCECGQYTIAVVTGDQAVLEGRRSRAGSGVHQGLQRYPGDPRGYVDSFSDLTKKLDKAKKRTESRGGYLEKDANGVYVNKGGCNQPPPDTGSVVKLSDMI